MDELEISGRRYISSVRAAKEHKYHSDYIGQLVRGGKVVGQKVGRAWYVDADSLAEYLGKEVPPRGPVAKKVQPIEEPAKEEKIVSVVEDKAEDSTEQEPMFVMPLRKSGRHHVIAAIGEEVPHVQPEPKKEIAQPIVEVISEEVVEEETFIPLKITKEPVRNLYAEPEDSFYKVSHKGLRYVNPGARVPFIAEERIAAPRTANHKNGASKALVAVSLVLAAGIVSLGAGVLMSYYLHSITTVQNDGQTSSVIFSN